MSSENNYKKIIKTWAKKGDLEDDNFSKFICYWVSFSCWLYTKTGEVRDRMALNKLYQGRHLYEDFLELVTRNKLLFEKLLSVCPIQNNRVKNRQKSIKNVEKFNEVVDVLYEIRCNLFHGSKLDTNERDAEIVKVSTPVLKIIVKNVCFNE